MSTALQRDITWFGEKKSIDCGSLIGKQNINIVERGSFLTPLSIKRRLWEKTERTIEKRNQSWNKETALVYW